jgi:hypothetical protein
MRIFARKQERVEQNTQMGVVCELNSLRCEKLSGSFSGVSVVQTVEDWDSDDVSRALRLNRSAARRVFV